MSRRVAGAWSGPPTVYEGLLFVASGDTIACVDMRRGKTLGELQGCGKPAVVRVSDAEAVVASTCFESRSGYGGDYQALRRVHVEGIGGKNLNWTPRETTYGGMRVEASGSEPFSFPAFLGPEDDVLQGTWYQSSDAALAGIGRGPFMGAIDDRLSPIATRPAFHDDLIYGFDSRGTLIGMSHDGRFSEFVASKNRPSGARAAAASIAGGVLYLGNWAVALDSARVLWCAPDIDPATPLIPVADGRVVYGTETGALVCLGKAAGIAL